MRSLGSAQCILEIKVRESNGDIEIRRAGPFEASKIDAFIRKRIPDYEPEC
jgi:hypothetical protein